MRPAVRRLKQQYTGQVDVISLNYGDRRMRKIVAEYGADFHPAFVFLAPDGLVLDVVLGELSETQLARQFERLAIGY